MTATKHRDSASNEDCGWVGSKQYVRTSQDARTIHVVAHSSDALAYCGAPARWSTCGEEHRLPMCRRCAKAVSAKNADDDDALGAGETTEAGQ